MLIGNFLCLQLKYALNEKKEGKSQYDIYAGLIERGVSEPYANYMINKLDEWAHSLQIATAKRNCPSKANKIPLLFNQIFSSTFKLCCQITGKKEESPSGDSITD